MRQVVSDIMGLVASISGKKLDVTSFMTYKLHSRKNLSPFESFLLKDRAYPFLFLQIIDMFCMDAKCYIAAEETEHSYQSEEIELQESKSFGPTVVTEVFTGNELFNHVLQSLSIASIANEAPLLGKRVGKNGIIEQEEGWQESNYPEVFVCIGKNSFILTGEEIYFAGTAHKEVEALLHQAHELAEKMLTYGNRISVPHELYIGWLFKWFPGKIRVRSLPGPE